MSEWKILNYKKVGVKNCVASFSIQLPSGMVVHESALIVKGDSRWIALPRQKFTKRDGTAGYNDIIQFASAEIAKNFQRQVLEALDLAAVVEGKR